ncbi:DUF3194 domain-containing protein [Halobacteriales archaeon SW_7_68_16]|nr:MAG: DUF3194 domain-containing protein [Halobacteriales archaeon SW_7_68_16]
MTDDPTPDATDTDDPSDERVVETAAEAATDLVFSRYARADVDDLDVTVSFEDGQLTVDVYLDVDDPAAEQVAEDATLAARSAVDDLFESA